MRSTKIVGQYLTSQIILTVVFILNKIQMKISVVGWENPKKEFCLLFIFIIVIQRCSFCQNVFESSNDLAEHLITCGNKTDQCANCQQFIRRAFFNYHYENNCADVNIVE